MRFSINSKGPKSKISRKKHEQQNSRLDTATKWKFSRNWISVKRKILATEEWIRNEKSFSTIGTKVCHRKEVGDFSGV